ncbi:TPR-like protein [Exidia glandulosa HHB12029]|uniref:TPR-like protein n=1 Tax=Exidia glandulosa HHB12029 TaxID=1314781 RepID=A0A165GB62_EXIGL|nr:TPR-like protein [Exidia glandulosa HHB12029]
MDDDEAAANADQDIDFREELRKATGIGKRRRGVSFCACATATWPFRRRGGAKPDLSQQVKTMLGDAVEAHTEKDLDREISILTEVIKIEPRDNQAWDMLCEAQRERGNYQEGLLFKIVSAHLRHETSVWRECADESNRLGLLQQALYCLTKICQLDPNDLDTLWERATLAKDLKEMRSAKRAFLAILKKYPHDLAVLFELQSILVDGGDFPIAIKLFEDAMHHYMRICPTGVSVDHVGNEMPGNGFGLPALVALADFCSATGDYERAIHVIRGGVRWLQGRQDQRFWDALSDDREYDVEGKSPARTNIGATSRPGYFQLDLNARHRLAIARLKLGDLEEGTAHAEIILNENPLEFEILFREIADAFYEQRLFEKANDVYMTLLRDESTTDLYLVMQAAACLRNMGRTDDAIDAYEEGNHEPDPAALKEAKLKLAELYEGKGELRKALNIVYSVIDARKRNPAEKDDVDDNGEGQEESPTLFDEKRKKTKTKTKAKTKAKTSSWLDPAQLEDAAKRKQAEVENAWRRLQEMEPGMRAREPAAETQWLLAAETMIEAFREARELFSTAKVRPSHSKKPVAGNAERVEDDLAARLQLELGKMNNSGIRQRSNKGRKVRPSEETTYRGIPFDTWLTVFLDYAFLLTRRGQYPLAEEILKHASYSAVYQEVLTQDTIRLGLLACAIYEQKFDTATEICRKFINIYQFQSDAFHLLTAALASGHLQADAFQDSRLQKHISREVRLNHTMVSQPESKIKMKYGRYCLPREGTETDKDVPLDTTPGVSIPKPEVENAAAWTIFAQTFLPAKSYQSATFYMMHAFELYPKDPVVCLTLAITCLGRAMQRQADNRHYMIVQAMAFLTKYKALRGPTHREEADYNLGRAFQQLGLFTEAVQVYERVLAAVEKLLQDIGVARETAYNMSLIYNSTGAIPLAQQLYQKWLTV